MLGKGLESLIPKKDGSGSEEMSERTDRPAAPALPTGRQGRGDFDSHPAGGSPINRGDQAQRDSEIFSTTPPQSHNEEINRLDRFPQPAVQAKREQKTESVFQIEVDRIKPNPHQPRRNFDEVALKELANSIREYGVLQPLVVSKIELESDSGTQVEYELIAGERRLMAAKMAGLHTVPAIIRRPRMEREKLELAIIENIQRADLNPIETARAFARLQDEFRLTQREIAAKVGKSREVIANSVRLLNLPSEIQEAVGDGRINESQARLLLAIEDIVSQRQLFEEILRNNLSVREIRTRVRKIQSPETNVPEEDEKRIVADPELDVLKEQLEEFLGTKIDLSRAGETGKITISFYSTEELKAIAEKLLKQNDTQSL